MRNFFQAVMIHFLYSGVEEEMFERANKKRDSRAASGVYHD